MLGKKKMLAIVAIVAIIISVCAVGVWYSTQPKAGMKIAIESIEEGENGLEINVLVMPSDSGEGSVRIVYDSLEMYSGSINIVNGKCTAVVPYNEFVIDNGNYTINITFKDKSDEKTHLITAVIKNIYISFDAKYTTQPVIDVAVWPSGLPGTEVTVTIKKQDGNVLADNISLDYSETKDIYEKEIPYAYSGYYSGNYSIYVTLTNPIKQDSEYSEVGKYLENSTGYRFWLIDLPPEITVYPQDITIYSRENTTPPSTPLKKGCEGWVHFASTDNAQDIYNEVTFSAIDHDGTFSVVWDMGYNQTNKNSTWINDTREGDNFWYQYPKVEEGGADRGYTMKLCVHDEHFMSETREFTITVKY